MKKKKVKRGLFYSINNKQSIGHKGRVASKSKSKSKVVQVTHSKTVHLKKRVKRSKGHKTVDHKIKTIPLNKNPDVSDKRKSYVLPFPILVEDKKIGKVHPDMKVMDKRDKSIFRHIGRKRAKKNRWD